MGYRIVNLPDGTQGQFPDTMSDDDIAGVLRKQFGGGEEPAESKAYALARSLGGSGRAAVTHAASPGGLLNSPLALVGALGSYMKSGPEMGFGDRWRREMRNLRGQQEETARESPTGTIAGSVAGPLAAAKAIPAAMSALAPVSSYMAQGMGNAGTILAGTLDSMLFGGAAAASREADRNTGQAVGQAMSSPENLVAGGVPVAFKEALPMARRASQAIGNLADRLAWKQLVPKGQSTWTQDAITKAKGTNEAGRIFRTMERQGSPVMVPEEAQRVRLMQAHESDVGARKGSIVQQVDEAAPKTGAVDFDEAAREIEGLYSKHFGTAAENVAGTDVNTAKHTARRMIDSFLSQFRPGYKATSTQVEWPAPPQGELGLPGQTTTVSRGGFLAPQEPGPPIAITRELRGATAEGPLEVASGATGQRGKVGTFRTDTGELYTPGKANEVVPPRPERLYQETMRPAPDTGWGVARPHTPAEWTQTEMPITQREGFVGNRMPEGTGPLARATDIEQQGIPLAVWERFKTNLQSEVYNTSGKHPRPETALEHDPTLGFLQDLGGAVRGAGEQAVERVLGPEAASEFQATKRQIGNVKTILPMAKAKQVEAETPRNLGMRGALDWAMHRAPYVGFGALAAPGSVAVGALGGLAAGEVAGRAIKRFTPSTIRGLGTLEEALARMPDLAPQSRTALATAIAARLRREEE